MRVLGFVGRVMKESKRVNECYYIVRISLYHAWIFGYGAFIKIMREYGKRMYVNKFIFEGVVGI